MNYSKKKKLPVILERGEAIKLTKIPKKRYLTGLRNLAILRIMLNMGLRVGEVANLKPGNVNLVNQKLRVVDGKGGKDRDLIIPLSVVDTLKEWKQRKPKDAKYFFTTIKNRKDGKFASSKGKKLSVRNIQAMVEKYAKRAGINKNVTPHTLRHTFATEYYRQTKDIETLRMILGHSDISTTQIYVTLANIDVENAMNEFVAIV